MPEDQDDEDRTVEAQAPRSHAVLPKTAPIALSPPPRSAARILVTPRPSAPGELREDTSPTERPPPPSMRLKVPLAEDFDPEDTSTTRGPAVGLYGRGIDAVAPLVETPVAIQTKPDADPGPDAPDESVTTLTRDPSMGAKPSPASPASSTTPYASRSASPAAAVILRPEPEPVPADDEGDSVTAQNLRERRQTVRLDGSPIPRPAEPDEPPRDAPTDRPPMLEPEMLDPPAEEDDIVTGVGIKALGAKPPPAPEPEPEPEDDEHSVTAKLERQMASAMRAQVPPVPLPGGSRLPPSRSSRAAPRVSPERTETPESMARTGQRLPETPESMARTGKHQVEALDSMARTSQRHAIDGGGVRSPLAFGATSFLGSAPVAPNGGLMQALIDERASARAPASMRQPIPTPSGVVLPSLDPSEEPLTFAPPSFDPSSTAVLRGEARLPRINDSFSDVAPGPTFPPQGPTLPPGPPLHIHPMMTRTQATNGVDPRWIVLVVAVALVAVLVPVVLWVGLQAGR